MADPATGSRKQTWLIIWASMCISVLMYGLVCFFTLQGRVAKPPMTAHIGFRPIAYGLALLFLIVSVGWLQIRLGNVQKPLEGNVEKVPLPTPGAFQSEAIIAMALAEACAIMGLVLFFLGAAITEFAIFAAGTLIVMIGVILPKGLVYWSAWEEQQKPKNESPFS